ncbi:hypothetical protein GCM10007158_32750 [Vreelandella hamiltonii]|jgi:monothiol glutaredoxin|uniref:Glutaredoxin domain-containing protein n=1 Tax=Halomonas johnsoniae TaxID=502832 RepID=A0ABQ2WUS7_9GAMM|nr:hypothetical protein GCM10007158_32750 [Halomonas johnsoniae]
MTESFAQVLTCMIKTDDYPVAGLKPVAELRTLEETTSFIEEHPMSTTADNIQRQITENPILIYMKGTPQLPQCGFSAQTVQALMSCGERFAFVNVLDNPDIRAELPKIANWPTFPQLWVEGELVGGCDIVMEMHQSGDLEKLIKEAAQRAGAAENGTDA